MTVRIVSDFPAQLSSSCQMLRVIVEPQPQSGAENMATDEALLESATHHGTSTLRVYRWDVPTVSLGCFQKETDPVLVDRFAGVPWIRRLSGGGALLHDLEITYSIALPDGDALADSPITLYDVVHRAIVEFLKERGAAAHVRGEKKSEPEPFLCFGRGDPRDIVLAGFKIVGSAQRRRRGAILQHGALLLHQSQLAPEFPGLFDLAAGVRIDEGTLAEELAAVLIAGLKMPSSRGELDARERERVRELIACSSKTGAERPLAAGKPGP